MAIDTAENRRSASGVAFFPLGPGVTPNVAKDTQWRQQVAWAYSGIMVSGEVPPPAVVLDFIVRARRRRHR